MLDYFKIVRVEGNQEEDTECIHWLCAVGGRGPDSCIVATASPPPPTPSSQQTFPPQKVK